MCIKRITIQEICSHNDLFAHFLHCTNLTKEIRKKFFFKDVLDSIEIEFIPDVVDKCIESLNTWALIMHKGTH